jgi:hypothetical protein
MLGRFTAILCVVCTLLLSARTVVYGKTITYHNADPSDIILSPSPDDTITYDSPPPIASFRPLDYGFYWAVRFTPAGNCTVKAGLVSVDIVSGTPVCSLFVWDDAGGSPGALVGGTPIPFAPTGYPNYDRVDLSLAYTDMDDFWIGIYTGPPPDEAAALTDSVTDYSRDYLSLDRLMWMSFNEFDPPVPGDLLIRAVVEYIVANPDVSVDTILAPADTVPCSTPAPVSASVCNVGDTTVTFDVEALIPGLYGDTVGSVTLGMGACSTLTFASWDVPDSHGFCFDVRFRTLLASDVDPTNDTMTTVSCADCPPGFRDVGVVSIDDPPDTVYADSIVPVRARVANLGDSTETSFFVSMTIDGYGDAVMVFTLAPGETVQVVFDSLPVPSFCDTTYTATAISLLGGDQSPGNDTLTKEIYARCPPGVSRETSPRTPRAITLDQSSPNPFSVSTAILYQLTAEMHVSLEIYDASGRMIRVLQEGVQQPGLNRAVWDGRDENGKDADSGIYFCRLRAGAVLENEFTQTRKVVLLR